MKKIKDKIIEILCETRSGESKEDCDKTLEKMTNQILELFEEEKQKRDKI